MFSLKFTFCNTEVDESIVVIVWDVGVPFNEPLKNTLIKSTVVFCYFLAFKFNVYSTPCWILKLWVV